MNNNTKYVQISTEQAARRSGRLYRASGNLLICKETSRAVPHNFVNTSRGSINKLTAGAATRMRRYLRECAAEYTNMVTLTYPGFYSSNGAVVKEHLRRFLQELKRKIDRDRLDILHYSTFWFLEFQERGAPHFHLFTTHSFDKDFVSRRWYEIVNSEDTRHLRAGTRVEKLTAGRGGTISYASKYAAKQYQKEVPVGYENVGRFWGVSGYRATMAADTFVTAEQARDGAIKNIEKRLFLWVQEQIYEANGELISREHGGFVFVLHNPKLMARPRLLISQLACRTMHAPQMFQDADIEYLE